MTYLLKIYKQDKRKKTGYRFCGEYEYDRKDLHSMHREIKELYPLYPHKEGYMFQVFEKENPPFASIKDPVYQA